MIQEIWYCILMAEIGIGASFEQFPSYTESILRTLKKKIKFSVYWRNILCRCVTMKARQPWGHASRVMESRQSRKSGTRPRVCRTCGQHHSHHEPHIYDYPEEVSQQIKSFKESFFQIYLRQPIKLCPYQETHPLYLSSLVTPAA